jgi:hypothetical protein
MMPDWAWAGTLAAAHIVLIQLPSHLVFRKIFPSPKAHGVATRGMLSARSIPRKCGEKEDVDN